MSTAPLESDEHANGSAADDPQVTEATGAGTPSTGDGQAPAPNPLPGPSPGDFLPDDITMNQAPQIYPVMDISDAHPETPVDVSVGAYDPNNDPITFSLTRKPANAQIDPQSGYFQWTPDWSQLGAHTVTVRVTDSHGAWTETSFIITVINRKPEIGTMMDQTGHPERSVEFTVYASDPDGDSLTYQMVQGPPGASVDPASGHFQWMPSWAQLGAHIVTIRVTDPGGASASDSCTVTINNQAPIMQPIGDQHTTTGAPIQVYPMAMDPDGDMLTYILVQGPTGASVDPSSGTFNWTPGSAQTGTHFVTIRCKDPGGAADQQSFAITVT